MEESDTAISARLSRCQVSTRDFDLVALAGRGAFGKVWVVRKKNDYSGKVMAMKEMSKKDMIERGYVGHTKQEKDIMALVAGSPFIVDLYFTFHSEANLYIIMEYVPGGNLLSYVMDTEEKWPEDQCRFYGAEILLGLEYIHSKNIVYKDLKLENVLLDIDGHIRLTDFGLSKRLASDTDRVNSMSGTAAYLAPEVIDSGGKGHGTSADVWAFGVLLFTILLHESPFYSENLAELFEMILHQNIEWEYYKEDLSPEALSLLEGLLTKDISKRLGCGPNKLQEIKDHPFFAQTNWEDVLQMKVKPPIRPKLRVAERATEQDKQDLYAGHVSKKSADRGEFADFSFVAADYLQQSNEASEADQSSWSWSDDEEGFAWPFPGFLPFSAVNQIVRYLSISDISRASQVCKSWNKFLWSNIHEINLSTVQPELFKQYWHSHICKVLKRPQRLLKMRMSPCCTDDAVAKIPSIPSLESLSFEGCSSITTTAITNLSKTTSKANSIRPKKLKFPMLGELNLSSCSGINDSALEQISKTVPLLKQLNLAFSISITDAGLSHLHRLRNLWRLDLQGLHSLSDHGIKQLVDLPNLRVLDLTGCANLTNNGVESLRTKAQQLEVLIWSDTSDPTEKGGKGMGFAQRFSKKNLFKTRDRSASTQYNVKPSMNFFKRKKKPTKRNERSASVCDSLPLSTVDSTNIDDEGNQGALSPRSRAKKLEKKIKEKMPKDRKKLKGTGDTIISPRPKKEKKLKQPKNKEKSNAIEQPIEQEDPNPPKTIPENEIDPAIPVPPGSPEAEIKQRLHKSIRDRYKKRKEAKKFDKSIMQTLLADETNIDTTPITLLDTDDPLTPRKPQDIAKLKSPRKGNEEKTNSTLTGDVPVGNKEDQPLEIPPIAIKKLSKTQEYDCPCDTSPKVLSPRSPHSPHSPHSPQSPHSRLSKSKVPKERSIGKSNQRFEDITVVAEVIPPTALSPRKESLGVTAPSISTNSEGDMLSKSATDTPIRDADFMFDEPHGDSQDGGNGTGLSKMLERVEDEHDEKRKASLVRSTI